MRRSNLITVILLSLILVFPILALTESQTETSQPKQLEDIADIIAWKSIRSMTISNDGAWIAYILAPQEGDGEVIVRQVKGQKEHHFPIGESPRYVSGAIAFSEDTQWVGFTIYPTKEEARKLKKQKKKLYNKAKLFNLSSEKEFEFEKIKAFAFAEENPAWVGLHKYPGENQGKDKEKWSGSDLLLFDLKSAQMLNIGNISEFAFNKKGNWLAFCIDAEGKSGNGIQLRNMQNGVIIPLDSEKAVYKQLTWTEAGDGLTVLKGKDNESYENELFSVLGFQNFTDKGPQKTTYDPIEDKDFPEKMTISPNRRPEWTKDFSGILFGIHELKEKKDTEKKVENKVKDEEVKEKEGDKPKPDVKKPSDEIDEEDLPGLVIWHWKDKRMQSMQQVQENRDKNFSFLCIYRVKEKKFLRLADDKIRDVAAVPNKHLWAIGTDVSEYELYGNLSGRRYADIYTISLETGKKTLALKKNRWYFGASPDGSHFFYYQDGHFFTYELGTGKSYNITKDVPTSFINTESDVNIVDPPIYQYGWGWTKDSSALLLYDNWDIWKIPVHGGSGKNLTVNGKQDSIRYRNRFQFDPDEKGIDLNQRIYISPYEEWTKKAGIGYIDKGDSGVKRLMWDDSSFSVQKAKKAEVFLYTKQTYKDYPDYYATDSVFKSSTKLTNANPQQKDYLWSKGAMLVDYQSVKGDKLQAALFLPANYEKGKKYPTIVYIYEKLSQRMNSYLTPAARGFNTSVYTGRGYAVLTPDIVYRINDPGMSAVWCVLPAIEAALATGVVDKERIGIHGHSWGGYQTSFLVTQTDVFAAAVAGAPLTNMLSMYSSVYWNSGSANQPIFESSQGRFEGNYLDNLEAYTRNSPVYYADKVTTPLIILHNDKDGAVDWNQGIEYFNTLRQLGKPVIMLQYVGENHGLRKPPNMKDYHVRMQEFFDHYLRGKPAPKWLTEGVSHLEHENHLKERTKKILKKK